MSSFYFIHGDHYLGTIPLGAAPATGFSQDRPSLNPNLRLMLYLTASGSGAVKNKAGFVMNVQSARLSFRQDGFT